MGNGTGNENDRRQSARNQRDVRNGERVSEHFTPVAARTADEIRNAKSSQKRENEATTSATRSAPINQRQSSRDVTRTISKDHRSRNGGTQSSKNVSHHSEKVLDGQRRSDERSDVATRRRSRDEAEMRVENEILEAMRREQELRYKMIIIYT